MFDEERHEFSPDTMRLATQFGFMLLVFAMWSAAACISAIALAGRAEHTLPGWLSTFSFVVSILLLFSFFFIPAIALPLWALVMSAWLWPRRPQSMDS